MIAKDRKQNVDSRVASVQSRKKNPKQSHSQSIKYHNAGRTFTISPRHRRFYLGLWCISNICASVEGMWSSCGGRSNSRGVDQGLTLFHNSLLNHVAAPSCSGKVLHVALKCQNVPLSVFKKGVAWQKKKERILRWEEVAIPGNIHLCPSCCSWNEQIWCIRVLLQRNVLHTPSTAFYMLAQSRM